MRSVLEYYCQIYTGDSEFDLDELLEEVFPFMENLETPSIQLPGTENTVPDSPSTDIPAIIEPKGEGTFL